MAIHFSLFLLLLITALCSAAVREELNGAWTLTGGDPEITLPAIVPGGVFSDLMNHGDIDDIFFGQGETSNSWVGESDWTYSVDFTVDEEFLAYRVVSLVFEGLDTFATVSVNDEEIGQTENMFRRYVFDVKDKLQAGSNTISVKFISAVNKAKELATNLNNSYAIPPDCPPSEYEGICYVNRIRKMQASFSWDWGPAFASVGIWKEVYLQAFDEAVIDHVVATTLKDPDSDDWIIKASIFLDGGGADVISGNFAVSLALGNDTYNTVTINTEVNLNEHNELVASLGVSVFSNQINIWWPNGYGKQDLYNFTAYYIGENERDEKTVRVGFRTVELVQDELGEGLTFYFKVNGRPIFAKGANEIPIDILPERGQDPVTIKNVLQSAKDAHMNMLRVWGGGVYESDYFYDLADEYGILIWQDFMFACALYPVDEDFLSNVVAEVRHQLKRLGSHPSIAIWAGNNENEAVLAQNWYGTTNNYDLYKRDYNTLYVGTIAPEVQRILPDLNYITSSPTNGKESDEEDHVARNPGDNLYGDVHFYDYSLDSWSISTFPTPRFASEYGYQSMPSIDSWLTATANLSNLSPTSDFLHNRQHHPGGNEQNLNLINYQLTLPDPSSENYVKAFVYFSQIVQAESIKTETEHYRSFKGRVNAQGQGYTMGALYWQLNDVWVAPTWSGMDFLGRWKILHYQAREFYSPMIITGTPGSASFEIYAVFDGLEAPEDQVIAMFHIYRWDQLQPLTALEFPITLDPERAVLVALVNLNTVLVDAGCGANEDEATKNCFVLLHIVDAEFNRLSPHNHYFPQKLKNSNLADANVEIASVITADTEGKAFEIIVTTDAVALFVWLDSHEIKGRFSENGFLQVEQSVTVNFIAEEPVTLDDLKATLTVTHVRDPAYL